jgi:hypothetical protein
LTSDSGSFSTRVTRNEATGSSLTIASSSFSSRTSTLEGSGTAQGTGTTNSPTFADGTYTSNLGVSGSLTVKGNVTAQEFHTEFVSASILYTSGSTKFGDTSDDIHQFSGSLRISGSGDHHIVGGNVGVGVTPETDWKSNVVGLQVGAGGSIFARRDSGETKIFIAENVKWNDTGYQRINSGYSAMHYMDGGAHNFAVAGTDDPDTTISFTSSLKLDINSRISLSNNDNGTSNTIFGKSAGASLDAGSNYNVFIGEEVSDAAMDDATNNVGVGYSALSALTTGDNNVAIGKESLLALTEGSTNTVLGTAAADDLETGSENVIIGTSAAGATEDIDKAVIIGRNAMVDGVQTSADSGADGTIAIGYSALAVLTSGAGNVAVGYQAGNKITTAASNTAIGYLAMVNNTTGQENTYLGYAAGSGSAADPGVRYNTGIGFKALSEIRGGDGNTAVGSEALKKNTSGGNNIAIGKGAGDAITTGAENVCIGVNAGGNFDTEGANVFVGQDAGGGAISGADKCVAVGTAALQGAATQDGTIAIGWAALNALTSGANNLAVGYLAGKTLTAAAQNLAIGPQALETHLTGESNIAIGYLAMCNTDAGDNSNDSGHNTFIGLASGGGAWTDVKSEYNVAIGNYTMDAALDGAGHNTCVGYGALGDLEEGDSNVCVGSAAGALITNASQNVCVGRNAGNTITTGGANTMVGQDTDVYVASNTNSSAFGNSAVGTGSNTISLGNTSISNIEGQVSFGTYSDERIKKSIADTDIGLDFIKGLKPRKFKRVCPKDYPEDIQTKYDKISPELENPDEEIDGLIAQEVKETMDSLGVSFSGWGQGDDTKQKLQYATFVMPLIKAVQELSAKVEALEAQVSGSS